MDKYQITEFFNKTLNEEKRRSRKWWLYWIWHWEIIDIYIDNQASKVNCYKDVRNIDVSIIPRVNKS